MPFSSSRRLRRTHAFLVVALVAIATFTLLTGSASAAPLMNTLSLAELQAKLDDAPSGIDGIMKTALKGTAISEINVKVLAIVPSVYPWGKLILLESDDPRITKIGGVAAGMSGSPIFINDEGTQKLIGAASWGEENSLNGSVMATPVEYMMRLEDGDYILRSTPNTAPRVTVELEEPVHTKTGTVNSIAFTKNASASTTTLKRGELVMRPMMLFQIAGASPGSPAYKKISARLTGLGATVVASSDPLRKASQVPPLQAGSPCGVTFSEGDLTVGAFGTVTYVHGQNVLAFAHPIFISFFGNRLGAGAIQGTLVGAVVNGITPSSTTPNKLMSPADTKGLATQDRSAGVLSTLTLMGAEMYPFTTDTTSIEGGVARRLTSTVSIGRWYSQVFNPESDFISGVAESNFSRVYAAETPPKSATTETTITCTCGGKRYTIVRKGVWGASDGASSDVGLMMRGLLADPYGVYSKTLKITSVHVRATFSPAVKTARLLSIKPQSALRIGKNTIAITYYGWGSLTPKTLLTTLTIPAKTNLTGTLSVSAPEEIPLEINPATPLTFEQTKALLESLPSKDTLTIAFTPITAQTGPTVKRNISTGLLFTGSVERRVAAKAPSRGNPESKR